MRFWRQNERGPAVVGAPTDGSELRYRATLIGERGTVVSNVRIAAFDDGEAREKAEALANGHAVDLWEGLRFVDHFPAIEASKKHAT